MRFPPLSGLFLFLFIPAVLALYLAMPLGPAASLALGVSIMVGHGFLARPYLRRHLDRRCFWCSGPAKADAREASFRSRGSVVRARACSPLCAERILSFARVVSAWRPILLALVVAPVALYLVNGATVVVWGRGVSFEAARWGFKVPIAAAVVGLSFAWPSGRAMRRDPAIDFPPHNLFLLGIGNTLWVFRIVGLWWLLSALWAALPR